MQFLLTILLFYNFTIFKLRSTTSLNLPLLFYCRSTTDARPPPTLSPGAPPKWIPTAISSATTGATAPPNVRSSSR
jgi:hypothetical protein